MNERSARSRPSRTVPAWQLCAVFGSVSLLSVGRGSTAIPHLQRETAPDRHWLTVAAQLADSFAIAQVTPMASMVHGPS